MRNPLTLLGIAGLAAKGSEQSLPDRADTQKP
jgi:hypothetical protein